MFRVFQEVKTKNKILKDDHVQNNCRLFHVLAQFHFTTSELKLDYYYQNLNVWMHEFPIELSHNLGS